jgi:ArsR family transcriptional regulator, arsenate/arsenite/antimonite-responsive transcriptional repressor
MFRKLVVAGHSGLTRSAFSEMLKVPATGLSFHLKELLHADLISQERLGRNLVYRAQFDRINIFLALLRSVLGEGMLNHWAKKLGEDVRAFSAGSAPSGRL